MPTTTELAFPPLVPPPSLAAQATWHPLCDLIVVGCYPDPNLPVRQGRKGDVEFFSARTGNLVASIQDPSSQGIVSLVDFNADGTKLMLGQGLMTDELLLPLFSFIKKFSTLLHRHLVEKTTEFQSSCSGSNFGFFKFSKLRSPSLEQ